MIAAKDEHNNSLSERLRVVEQEKATSLAADQAMDDMMAAGRRMMMVDWMDHG